MAARLTLVALAALHLAWPTRAAAPPAGVALKRYSFEQRHMGTLFRIILYAPDDDVARRAARAGFARVAELNAVMSDYQPTSELMRLCAKAGGPPVKVSDDLFVVLKRSQEVAARSGGAFDVTVGPVVRLWRRSRRTQVLPDAEKLAAARALVGYKLVVLDEKARTVRLLKAGMQLDLGGIGKGYAADAVLAVLARFGITRALVAAGGDIAVSGPPPGKKGWAVAIAPLPGESPGGTLTLAHAAVSTSGDAEQFVEIDGRRYSHIVDPRTGIGLVGQMSATVIAPTGTQADSLTKVLAVLGPKRAFPILLAEPGVSARMVRKTARGLEVKTSRGFPKLSRPEQK
jgi:thiamine biosynthesis lipoprotein